MMHVNALDCLTFTLGTSSVGITCSCVAYRPHLKHACLLVTVTLTVSVCVDISPVLLILF